MVVGERSGDRLYLSLNTRTTLTLGSAISRAAETRETLKEVQKVGFESTIEEPKQLALNVNHGIIAVKSGPTSSGDKMAPAVTYTTNRN